MTTFQDLGAGGRRDIAVAREHCGAMRALVMRTVGGREDRESLRKLREILRSASAAIDDADCRSLLSSVERCGADLFSKSGHLKWATAHVSGADVLTLQILRELDAFEARLLRLEAARNATGWPDLARRARPGRA